MPSLTTKFRSFFVDMECCGHSLDCEFALRVHTVKRTTGVFPVRVISLNVSTEVNWF